MLVALEEMNLSQMMGGNRNNEQLLTSSASQWCSSPTLQHLHREQKQAEVKNTLPLAGKCKQAANETLSHLDQPSSPFTSKPPL